jgi:hypothetical protein
MAKVIVTQTPHHFARNHMNLREYGLYSAVRELSHKCGFLYFDGDDLAASFAGIKRDVIFRTCKALLKSGWFEQKGTNKRRKDGTYEARKIVALSHLAWQEKYPSGCKKIISPVAPVRLAKVEKPAVSSSEYATHQSHQCYSPVANTLPTSSASATKTSLQSRFLQNDIVQTDIVRSSQDSGSGGSGENPADETCHLRDMSKPPRQTMVLASELAKKIKIPTATDLANGNPSKPAVSLFNIEGVGYIEGTSYADAEAKVKDQREAYLTKKGESR